MFQVVDSYGPLKLLAHFFLNVNWKIPPSFGIYFSELLSCILLPYLALAKFSPDRWRGKDLLSSHSRF